MTVRRFNLAGAIAVVALLIGLPAANARASASQQTARTVKCPVGDGAGFGYEYLLSLKVTGTSCSTGDKLVRAKGKLAGWHCTLKVLQKDTVQYVGRETCTSGRASAVYEFTQQR